VHVTPEDIVHKYLGLARRMAKQFADPRLPNDYDELLSAAYTGLVKAAQAGLDRPAYIESRVKGEIKDAMRASDILSRRDRAILKAMKHSDGDIESVANCTGLSPEKVAKRVAHIQSAAHISRQRSEATYSENSFDETLDECLSILPAHLHVVFLAFYRDGRSRKEMAKLLKLPRPTVTDHLREISAVFDLAQDVLRDTLL